MKKKPVIEQNANPLQVKTHDAVGKALKVSARTVYHWQHDGMPQNEDGTFDLVKIMEWRKNKLTGTGKEESGEKNKWDTQYRQYKALNEELEYLKKKGDLLDKHDVLKEQSAQIQDVKRKFLVLGTQVAPQLVGLSVRDIQSIIDSKVKEIIRSFYEKKTAR
ncbi:MAG: hypothetical protein WC373_04880 [Smithella sp.]|jgi:hypothetical protein